MNGFILKQGTTFLLAAAIRDGAGGPADLTGCTFACQMRDSLNNLVATVTVKPVAGRTGVIQMTAGDTAGWAAGAYFVDLQTTWPNGVVSQTGTWRVFVVPAITQPEQPTGAQA
ncbi:hypothetical protein [Komagataeibacter xylinus]|uniref:hypothetical protein n=1 Tax=Komagataeibacter xylinus TaxID=28448 RepID=UPI00280A85E8|nr:hypothetical protein [Komagataeibacter xylinus]